MSVKLTVTLYANLYETTPLETRTIGWPEFLNIFCELGWRKAYRGAALTKKKDLPLWSPIKLIDGKTRHSTSIEYVSALVLDYDGNADSSDIESVWGDWLMCIHTTWNHTAELPRFRVVLPLLRDVDRREYERIIRWAMSRSDKLGLKADPSCKRGQEADDVLRCSRRGARGTRVGKDCRVWHKAQRLLSLRRRLLTWRSVHASDEGRCPHRLHEREAQP